MCITEHLTCAPPFSIVLCNNSYSVHGVVNGVLWFCASLYHKGMERSKTTRENSTLERSQRRFKRCSASLRYEIFTPQLFLRMSLAKNGHLKLFRFKSYGYFISFNELSMWACHKCSVEKRSNQLFTHYPATSMCLLHKDGIVYENH